MFYIAICDDDKEFIKFIKNLILDSGSALSELKFYEFYSGEEFAEVSTEMKIDLLILDMQMKKMDGDETAKIFRQKFPLSMLVFCSGVCQPTVKSFEVMPFRYLLKEYSEERMQHEIKVIIKEMINRKEVPFILGKRFYNIVKLVPEEILYISISKRGSNIFLYSQVTKVNYDSIFCEKKLQDLYIILRNYDFEYAHNSYIVNLKYIKRKTIKELEMLDGTILSISRSREKELRTTIAKSLSSKY